MTVIYGCGTHELPRDTRYLGVGIRIQVFDPKDADEVSRVNGLQDQFVIRANSADPWPALDWDAASLKELTARYEKESAQYQSWKGMMGPRGKADEKTRHIAAAAAWGLFPREVSERPRQTIDAWTRTLSELTGCSIRQQDVAVEKERHGLPPGPGAAFHLDEPPLVESAPAAVHR